MMKKISSILIAAALVLGGISCTKNTTNNNYIVDPGTDPGTNPGGGPTDPQYYILTPPAFQIPADYWSYLIATTGGKADTFFRAICAQDDIADGGIIIDMRILYSSGQKVSLPDTSDYTTFTYAQTDTGFIIEFHDIDGFYPGEPGSQTFEVDIQVPAEKGGHKAAIKTVRMCAVKTAPYTPFAALAKTEHERYLPAPTNHRTR